MIAVVYGAQTGTKCLLWNQAHEQARLNIATENAESVLLCATLFRWHGVCLHLVHEPGTLWMECCGIIEGVVRLEMMGRPLHAGVRLGCMWEGFSPWRGRGRSVHRAIARPTLCKKDRKEQMA